jgi:hypothetical protein
LSLRPPHSPHTLPHSSALRLALDPPYAGKATFQHRRHRAIISSHWRPRALAASWPPRQLAGAPSMWAMRYESCSIASRPRASTSTRRGNAALSKAPQALHLRLLCEHRPPYRRRRPAILPSTSALRPTSTCLPSTSIPRASRPALAGLTSTQHHGTSFLEPDTAAIGANTLKRPA